MAANGLIQLLIAVIVGGLIAYLAETFLPSPFGWIIALVVGVVILVWVIKWLFGALGAGTGPRRGGGPHV